MRLLGPLFPKSLSERRAAGGGLPADALKSVDLVEQKGAAVS